ncbi:MAG: hypothetical protein IAF38_08420 [Bacteroidia bacterium]|nr:hypothetical protein [Bacteroidia bacterium]
MNAYILLPQKNVQINNIPPRLMWNIVNKDWGSSTSGYCGETAILSAGLLYGQYVPMYLIRQLMADYFYSLWGADSTKPSAALKKMWNNYYGVAWSAGGSPGGDYGGGAKNFKEWFKDHGQYYCQVLPQIWNNTAGADNTSFNAINTVLQNLHLAYNHFTGVAQDTVNNFIPWMKQQVVNGFPVIIGVLDFLAGSNDNDFDHVPLVIGWGSNHELSNNNYLPGDEIVFSDHGLVIGGQQPHGGSIPYYFRYVMETANSFPPSGGWLPDGGCTDATNPAWDFIMDLGTCRKVNANGKADKKGPYTCNTYQLAQSSVSKKCLSDGNAGFAVTGLSDTLPPAVQVRIDTDLYYQIPSINAHEAKNGIQPACAQTINHSISITGLDASKKYTVWLFTAADTAALLKIPTSGFNAFGTSTSAKSLPVTNSTSFSHVHALAADVALLVRCVLATDK